MRIVFAGTPDFALPSLAAVAAEHKLIAVYTQPDRPAGRGRRVTASPVKRWAREKGLPVHQPQHLRDGAGDLARLSPEVMVVVAYGLLLPPDCLAVPSHGCINVHASLLPRWRGAAPIQRAIEAGDSESGVSIMQMEAGLDTGPVFDQARTAIGTRESAGELHDRLSRLGAERLLAVLEKLERGEARARPQPETGVRYAARIAKAEAAIDWQLPAEHIARRVRAFNPWPVAFCQRDGVRLRILEAIALPTATEAPAPGTVVAGDNIGIHVATGAGQLLITRLQAPGGLALSAAEYRLGHPLRPGERLA
ncbi:MAG: methionyl-tRNA formyltransferase [Gammaproteobacteria bacterium]|nr:methionyl-tRNA formyltransferase [Gammaproteobacteria bacterium]